MLYNWKIIGHEKQLQNLEADIRTNNLSHAYLFTGPGKMGKFTVAKKLAYILQCPNNYCMKCPVCTQIEKGSHPDTIEMRDNQESIKINEVREIINRLNMTSDSRYKVVLLENTARMSIEAMNSLLKILEEPPEKTIFILTASNPKDLPETIVSRTRIIKFSSFSDTVLFEKMKERITEVSEEELQKMCSLALGRPGKVFNFINDYELFNYYKNLYDNIWNFLKNDNIAQKFQFVNEISSSPDKVKDLLDILTHLIRSILIKNDGFKIKNTYTDSKLLEILNEIFKTKQLLKRNVNTRLTLENLMLTL